MMNRFVGAILLCGCLANLGCFPSTRIVKNPGDHDRGVRYYRPKPYLFVKPMVNDAGEPVSGFVNLEQAVLPDFSEEYSIHVRSGMGVNNTSINLTDGWRLDSINVELDSQVDENLKAVAEVAKAIPSLAQSPGAQRMAVRATNVPLGYYESVVSRGRDGKKRLYGFRYVGFMPYSACPIESNGLECTSCYQEQVYGLVFEEGGMVFRLLSQVPEHDALEQISVGEAKSPQMIGDEAEALLPARP